MQPVKKQLRQFVVASQTNEEYEQRLAALQRASKSPEWKYIIEILWSIKNQMAMELLQSSNYTKSSIEDKDRIQKVYNNVNEWIDFLVNPMNWIKKKGMLSALISRVKSPRERKE